MASLASSRQFSSFDYKRDDIPKLADTRQLYRQDKELVQALVNESTKRLFGEVDVHKLLNLSFVCLGLENTKKQLAAAIFLNNYPNVPSIPSWDWSPWLQNIYGVIHLSASNTLWLHLVVNLYEYTKVFWQKLLLEVFQRHPYVFYVVFIAAPHVKFTDWLVGKSVQVSPKNSTGKAIQTLHIFMRQKYTPVYKTRAAVIEDNDDVVALVDTHSKRLKQTYGHFYIAEMLKLDSKRKVVVAEHNEKVIAVLCLNSTVNLDLLNEQFQLEVYNAFRVSHHADVFIPSVMDFQDAVEEDSVSSFFPKDHTTNFQDDEIHEPVFSISIRDLNRALDLSSLEKPEEVKSITQQKEYVESVDEDIGKVYLGYSDPKFSMTQLTYNDHEQNVWRQFKYTRKSNTRRSNITNFSVGSDYYGASNCFCIELAAAQPEHELSLRELLIAGFDIYPDREYCVLSVPSTSPPFELQTNAFVRVPPRPKSTFSSELYLAHRSAISGHLHVRESVAEDIVQVKTLMRTFPGGREVYQEYSKVIKTDSMSITRQAYVVLCESEMVGVAILSEVKGIDYIQSHYDISRFTDLSKHQVGCLGQLEALTVSPIFLKHIRFILLELHRLSDYSFLCYKIPFSSKGPSGTLCTSLCAMLPVLPVKIQDYHVKKRESSNLSANLEKPFALYISTPAFCGGSMIEVNDKIVVVGASNVAISFLVEMAFQRDSRSLVVFNNLTLVSTHGLQIYDGGEYEGTMIPLTTEIDSDFLSFISLTTYVNVIRGVMEGIDRKGKCLTVNSSRVPYDILILTCGRQFLMPRRKELDANVFENPSNVFVINTPEDVKVAINKLKKYSVRNNSNPIVVYGNALESYATVQCLLRMGFLPSEITLVLPRDGEHGFESVFNDPDISRAVMNHAKNLGIVIYKSCSFKGWMFDTKCYSVSSINFHSANRSFNIPCLAIFVYGKKDVSPRTFNAIRNAGLVYDGAVVINTDFTTNDPDIYAAGTMTKYPRRYYADKMLHAYYDQSEIGKHLYKKISDRVLPLEAQKEIEIAHTVLFGRCDAAGKMLVPHYVNPVKVSAEFPGNIHYFSLRKPGFIIPYTISVDASNLGTILTTGDWMDLDKQGYFKLRLSRGHSVESITCLRKSTIETVNLTRVWGKHAIVLNNLMVQYRAGLIEDFFHYFEQPYMMAIYNTKFDRLSQDIMGIMTLSDNKGNSLIEDLVGMFEVNNWNPLSKHQETELISRILGSDLERVIEDKVVEFLQDNRETLPMFGTPAMYDTIVGNCEDSILFKPL